MADDGQGGAQQSGVGVVLVELWSFCMHGPGVRCAGVEGAGVGGRCRVWLVYFSKALQLWCRTVWSGRAWWLMHVS